MLRSIRELRKEIGLTQSQLAYICGVSRNTICSIERGEYNAGILLALKLDYVFCYGEMFQAGGYKLDLFEAEELSARFNHIFGLSERPGTSEDNNYPTP